MQQLDDLFVQPEKSAGVSQKPLEVENNLNDVDEEVFVFPLSFAQQRLWFLDRLVPNSPIYNISGALNFRGLLNVAALEQSINEIVRRHEALRTTFAIVEGQPVQVIHSKLDFQLTICDLANLNSATIQKRPRAFLVDLSELPVNQQNAEVQRLINEEAKQPFNLNSGPLLRVALLRLNEEEHVFLLSMHHIVSDGWSLSVFMQELMTLYQAFSGLHPSPLPDLPIQYADFAVWQRQWLQGENLESKLSYWKQQLGGNLPTLHLPTDRRRPAISTFKGGLESLTLPKSLAAALNALSRRSGVTLFMTLLAAFKTLLYRYTGSEDILVGSPIANRDRAEIEGLIGFFVNTLVLRADLSGNPSFRQLLLQVREVTLEAYANQDLPFEQLVEVLQPDRDLSKNPVFQVMFVLQNVPVAAIEAGLNVRQLDVAQTNTAKFDLTLAVEDRLEELICQFEYSADLFDASTIQRMAGHFQSLLEAIAINPDRKISDLPLLSELERQQLADWNNTQAAYPMDACIHQLFEAQAEKTPDAVAVVSEGKQLTYRELNARANQLARHLQALGVGPEKLVGICVERSLEMIVGLLGILKAGGAYLPLDPQYPDERLAFMLEDARVSVLLTQARLVKSLAKYLLRVVCLDAEWEAIASSRVENPISPVTAQNLAYVTYTSGSTGKPKGVSVIHQGVVRLVQASNYVNLSPEEVFLQLAPISFDASTFEIWGCLLNGGRLVVMPAQKPSLQDLGQAIRRYKITTLWLTAGLFHLMVDEQLENLKHVRQLLAGGDILSVLHVKKVLQELTGCRLINGYGPTENTTFSCCYPITNSNRLEISVPIGRPIANTRCFILDSHLQQVPIGIPGELYISGAGLARGYLNRPDLTAERFIPNLFSDAPGSRLYKTGDLVRYLPDGNIEYLGRIDDQVKIRGFRIELGEIEAVLSQHPDVRSVAVTVREDFPGDKRIVAYIVSNLETPEFLTGSQAAMSKRLATDASSKNLRSFLKEKLPDYMVPDRFIFLDVLPLTPNGKVDRKALLAPETLHPELQETYIAPQTEIERTIATVWQEFLRLEKVGVHDNFFDIGGHSLLVAQVHNKLLELLPTQVSLIELFKYPTISSLAKALTRESGEESSLQTNDESSADKLRDSLRDSYASRAKKQKEAINRQKERRQRKNNNG